MLDSEDERECAEGFLAAGELADFLLLVVLGVEGYGDADADIFFNFAALYPALAGRGFVVAGVVLGAVGFAVDDQAARADGDEFLEDAFEGDGDLFKGTGDGLILALVQDVDEVFDRFARAVEFGAAICESFALPCEVLILFVRLLVDVCELFLCLSGF